MVPLGNASQFQPRELYQPPNQGPLPPVPGQPVEPLYAYPSGGSIYGTLPRGPPRPVEPLHPSISAIFHEEADDSSSTSSSSESDNQRARRRLAVINYATFRQNISEEAAAAALRRAEIAAHCARHWSDEDLSQMPTLTLNESSTSSEESRKRSASPSPSASRRSNSPGKTVTFLEQERSLNELDASPRRMMDFKSLISSPNSKVKRKAPSPPTSPPPPIPPSSLTTEDSDEEDQDITECNNGHEPLGARLSASLRQTFRLR